MQETRYTRIAQAVNLALFILLLGGSLWGYPSLPEKIPTSIRPGTVHYEKTTLLKWLVSSFLQALVVAIPYGSVRLTARTFQQVIGYVRTPDTYRSLSPQHKKIVTDLIRAYLHWLATPFLLSIIVVQVGFYHIATSSLTTMPSFVVWTVGGLILLFIGIKNFFPAWWLPRYIQYLVDQENRRDRGDGNQSEQSKTDQ